MENHHEEGFHTEHTGPDSQEQAKQTPHEHSQKVSSVGNSNAENMNDNSSSKLANDADADADDGFSDLLNPKMSPLSLNDDIMHNPFQISESSSANYSMSSTHAVFSRSEHTANSSSEDVRSFNASSMNHNSGKSSSINNAYTEQNEQDSGDDDSESANTLDNTSRTRTSIKEESDSLASVRAIKPGTVPPLASSQTQNLYEFDITVSDPQTVGDGLSAYTEYKITTKTNSPQFPRSEMAVQRRFREFLWLYGRLTSKNPGMFVPPAPEKQSIGRFDQGFIENRIVMLESMLRRISRHSVLSKDPDFRAFLEQDVLPMEEKKSHSKSLSVSSGSSFMSKLGDAVSGIYSSKFVEIDDWFAQKRIYVDDMERKFKAISRAVDSILKYRDQIAEASEDFAGSVTSLASSELNTSVETELLAFADTQQKIKLIESDQGYNDLIHLANGIDEYIRIIQSVKFAFLTREKIHQSHLQALANLSKFKINLEKLKMTFRARPDKISSLESDILHAETKIIETKKEFEEVSKVIKDEMEVFEQTKILDIQDMIFQWLNSIIKNSERTVKVWKEFSRKVTS